MQQYKSLSWLIRLRFWAFIAQCLIILACITIFKITLPLNLILPIVVLFGLLNLPLSYLIHRYDNVPNYAIGIVFIVDMVLFTFLLAFTGGATNPFSVLYLVHITLAAVVLGQRWTWTITLLSVASYGALFYLYKPLAHEHEMHHSMSLHLYGMWFALSVTAVIIAHFLTNISFALKQKEKQLRKVERNKLMQERLASLTSLSAGAAHELRTPLSTISVIAKEFEKNFSDKAETLQDTMLIQEEVERCSEILDRMAAKSGHIADELPSTFSVSELKSRIIQQLPSEVSKMIKWEIEGVSHLYLPKRTLEQSLLALVKNGFDATEKEGAIKIQIQQLGNDIRFSVTDNGEGIPEDIIDRVGEPFFTTKSAGRGMGLGVFLVKLFCERYKGEFCIDSKFGQGTTVNFEVPALIKSKLKAA